MDLVESELSIPFYSFYYGASTVGDICLLAALAHRHKATDGQLRYLEIGTWRGESLMAISPIADEVVAVTLPEHQMIAHGFDPVMARQHLDLFGRAGPPSNVRVVEADSSTLDWATLDFEPNLIYIDGDHSHDGVLVDSRKALQVVARGGSIVWNDYMHLLGEPRWDVVAAIHRALEARVDDLRSVGGTLSASLSPFTTTLAARSENALLPPTSYAAISVAPLTGPHS